ncbi:hypothetical protein KIN20_016861 [Parelaphostrongylus tenuis]|uniref:Uncharacterized protein n=1 Tax=Parelaphostrongylus tenuis TaxID=148309 RepID=A0AAD5QR16_PARTN|nr:hypothetical protein KIN20_016861 [Parelaphostrongylus tenuis]
MGGTLSWSCAAALCCVSGRYLIQLMRLPEGRTCAVLVADISFSSCDFQKAVL